MYAVSEKKRDIGEEEGWRSEGKEGRQNPPHLPRQHLCREVMHPGAFSSTFFFFPKSGATLQLLPLIVPVAILYLLFIVSLDKIVGTDAQSSDSTSVGPCKYFSD